MTKQVVACKAILVRDGKILLLRESSADPDNTKAGQYQIPGGRIKPGEPFLNGLIREVKEETGLMVKAGNPFHVDEWFPRVRDQDLHIVAIFFICEVSEGDVALSSEHDDYVWATATLTTGLPIMLPDSDVVKKYFEKHN